VNPDLLTLVVVVFGGIAVAATRANVLMYRQIGELRIEVAHLANAISKMTDSARDERAAYREDHEVIHRRIDNIIRINGG